MVHRFCGYIFLYLLVAAASTSLAEDVQESRIYRNAYYLGRGDTGIADADNHQAIFYNPSGLAKGKGLYKEILFASPTVVVSQKTSDLVRKTVVEEDNTAQALREFVGENQHIGLNSVTAIVFRRAAIGVLAESNNNVLLSKSPDARAVEIATASSTTNGVATFSMAESFWSDFLLVGTTVKYVSQKRGAIEVNVIDASNISDQLSNSNNIANYTGTGFDLGFTLQWAGKNPMNLGLTIENVGDTKLSSSEAGVSSRKFGQTINMGYVLQTGSGLSKMKLLVDIRDLASRVSKNFTKKIHIGAELDIAGFAGLSFGLNQGYPGIGTYVDLRFFRMDVGTYTQEVGSYAGSRADSRYYISFGLRI